MALQSFQKALGQVKGGKPPHLLLGNGFSRARPCLPALTSDRFRAPGEQLKLETLRALEYQIVKQDWYRPEML